MAKHYLGGHTIIKPHVEAFNAKIREKYEENGSEEPVDDPTWNQMLVSDYTKELARLISEYKDQCQALAPDKPYNPRPDVFRDEWLNINKLGDAIYKFNRAMKDQNAEGVYRCYCTLQEALESKPAEE